MRQLNIGELIKVKVEEKQMNVTDFAKAINCSRSSIYSIFNSSDISIKRLMEISRVLQYDFIGDICSRSVEDRLANGEIPFISIPIINGKADFSSLPKEIYDWIKNNATE